MRRGHSQCTHLNSVKRVVPSGDGCVECLAMGDTWVHLRLCRTCGHVGCCDDSKNRHARKHAGATGQVARTRCAKSTIQTGTSVSRAFDSGREFAPPVVVLAWRQTLRPSFMVESNWNAISVS